MPVLVAAGVVTLVVAIALLPQIREFRDSVSEVTGTDSKLRYAVPVPEAFGVWPSGEFLYGNNDQGSTSGGSSPPSGSPASPLRRSGG